MVNLFEHKDYREFLQALIQNQSHPIKQVDLAKAMGCQAAYLSQILKGKAELTEDQGIKLCLFLHLTELETEYFLIILRMARSGTQELRRYLERLRQEIFQKQIELEGRINSTKTNHLTELNMYYCSSWIPAAIHVATSCNKFQTVQALMDKFGLKQDVVEMHLRQLEKYRLVQQQDNQWIFSGGSIHFSKNSEMDQTFQINRRVQAISKISVRKQTNIHYANLFTVDHATALEIRKILLSTLEKVHNQVEPAPSEDVYGICLDFFEA